MIKVWRLVLVALSLLAIAPGSAWAIGHDAVYLGDVGDGYGMNNKGTVAWSSYNTTDKFLAGCWGNGEYVALGAGLTSGINSKGEIVGQFFDSRGTSVAAYWGEDGKMTLLDPTADFSKASKISDKGLIVGSTYDGPGSDSRHFPAIWKIGKNGLIEETKIDIPLGTNGLAEDVNNRGQVVGMYYTDDKQTSFVWKDGKMTLLAPEFEKVQVKVINDKGEMAGLIYIPEEAQWHAARFFQDGSYELLSSPASGLMFVMDINNKGDVVGSVNAFGVGALLWERDGTLRVITEEMPGWQIDYPTSINDKGELLCWAYNQSLEKAGYWIISLR